METKSKNNRDYRVCKRCIMDTTDPDITFDEKGYCNHCNEYFQEVDKHVFKGKAGEEKLKSAVDEIKKAGENREFDCILGLSGGVDSTYLAYIAKQQGLRPLAVHFDNGWNSELATKNIENIVSKLGFELYTYVINWDEFRDLQLAYLKASVVDIEVITDHAIYATLVKLAAKHKVHFLLSGANYVTEAIMPSRWIFDKVNSVNIKAIHKEFGTKPLKTYPFYDTWAKNYYAHVFKLRSARLLNYIPYIKSEVKETITKELGWRDYGGKHYESIFTRFYQGYILPEKFNIDKRKAHLSTLICSGQITREEALEELKKPVYDEQLFKVDKEFVLKKLGLSEQEFEAIMQLPVREHTDFAVDQSFYKRYPILKPLKPLTDFIKR